jgi:hypothetical protein
MNERLCAIALRAGLLAALAGPPARARGAPVVEFSASDPTCPAAEFVDERFWWLVGHDVETRGRAKVTATKAEQGSYEFSVAVENGSERGQRSFSAESCKLGAETAALIIAISLFPERSEDLERRARSSSAEANPAPRSATPGPSDGARTPAPDRAPRADRAPTRRGRHPQPRGLVALGAELDVTSMPGPAMGFELLAGLDLYRSISIEVAGAQFFSQTMELSARRGADFNLQKLGAHACYAFLRRARASVGACLGATVARLSGEGFGAQYNHQRAGFFGGPALGSLMRLHASDQLSLRIYAESCVSLARPRFELETRPLHRPGWIGLSTVVGPELRF